MVHFNLISFVSLSIYTRLNKFRSTEDPVKSVGYIQKESVNSRGIELSPLGPSTASPLPSSLNFKWCEYSSQADAESYWDLCCATIPSCFMNANEFPGH